MGFIKDLTEKALAGAEFVVNAADNTAGYVPASEIATSGANSNITSLSGLTTPLSVGQGGTGLEDLADLPISDDTQDALDALDTAKEDSITAATEDDIWQGDKTWVAKTALPISTDTQTALDLKADINKAQYIATDLTAAAAATIPAAAKVAYIQSYSSSSYGVGGAHYKRATSEPTHDLKFRSTDRYLPNGTTDATNGGWWEVSEDLPAPAVIGAVDLGDIETHADIQKAIDWYARWSQYELPTDTYPNRSLRRRLSLRGGVYKIGQKVDLTDAHGLDLCDGTLIADTTATWAGGEMVLISDGTFGAGIDNVTVQCNGEASGVLIDAAGNNRVTRSRIYGWGIQDFGVRCSPTTESRDPEIIGNKIQGWIGAEGNYEFVDATGIGVDMQVNDSRISGNVISHGLYQIKLTGGGTVISHNHPYGGWTDATDQINILLDGGRGIITDNYIDNGMVRVRGATLNVQIQDNWFLSNTDNLTTFIEFAPTTSGQDFADVIVTGNTGSGRFVDPVRIDTDEGSFDSVVRGLVANNRWRSDRAGQSGYGTKLMETRGSVRFTVGTGKFNGSNELVVDLNNVLFLPTAVGPTDIIAQANLTTLSSITLQGQSYNKTTGKLTLKYSAAWNGVLVVNFDQAVMFKTLTADAVA